jgi:hypothetical protein
MTAFSTPNDCLNLFYASSGFVDVMQPPQATANWRAPCVVTLRSCNRDSRSLRSRRHLIQARDCAASISDRAMRERIMSRRAATN